MESGGAARRRNVAEALIAKNWRDLIKPRGLHVEQDTLTDTYGKFVAEPLERGFGITLGNALTRVLFRSLEGGAMSSVRSYGVEAEFSTISLVGYDVAVFILYFNDVV